MARFFAYQTHCNWCLKQYHCRWRLICHLQFSGTQCLHNTIATHTPITTEMELQLHTQYKHTTKMVMPRRLQQQQNCLGRISTTHLSHRQHSLQRTATTNTSKHFQRLHHTSSTNNYQMAFGHPRRRNRTIHTS